ncbi:hypothetical protein ANO11243_076890 [Dothideomycetidae sp. 11243]|nr:hypothetical protein ANO11243_076890 [fungal sp. No.11243]
MLRIKAIDMHTAGEPTRIVYSGLPALPPMLQSLAEKRQYFRDHCDGIRRCLMLEPRGHQGMYGALILPRSLDAKGAAAQVVFICASEPGYTTMCGHATFALARFLVDYVTLIDVTKLSESDRFALPDPEAYQYDPVARTKKFQIEVPCGLLDVTVPVQEDGKSDPSRAASFISVPASAHLDISIDLPPPDRTVPLTDNEAKNDIMTGDLAYGGGWYFITPAASLGIIDLSNLSLLSSHQEKATALLQHLRTIPSIAISTHPDSLYGVILSAPLSDPPEGATQSHLGLCVFASGQLDRSPTGGAVVARQAAAFVRGAAGEGDRFAYYSPTSLALGPKGAFVGSVVVKGEEVRVRVSGMAFYTGKLEVLVESVDPLGVNGFVV